MNFIKELNRLESESLHQILTMYIDILDNVYNDYLFDLEKEVIALNTIVSSTKEKYIASFVRVKIDKVYDSLRLYYKITSKELASKNDEVGRIVFNMKNQVQFMCDTQKEVTIANTRLSLIFHRINGLGNTLRDDMVTNVILQINNIIDGINRLSNIEYRKLKRISTPKENIEESIKLEKIYNYKDMEALARDNGYEFNRQSGDHLIYKHYKTNRIVVIPAHRLEKSLSFEIQKQLYSRRKE